MKRKQLVAPLVCTVVWCLWVFLCPALFAAGGKAVPVGATLSEFVIDGEASPDVKQYLGLQEAKPFTLSQIDSKLILVEFFSMYCPVCQRQAPNANKIFKFIEEDPVLSKDIKFLAIGITNKAKEVDTYRQTFRVKFPLFADPNKEIAAKTGIEDIPLTLLIDKQGKVLLSHLGVVKDIDGFMREIRKLHKEH